jgi:hypothetical protein
MRPLKLFAGTLLVAAATALAPAASAHGPYGRGYGYGYGYGPRVGVYVGPGPYWGPGYWGGYRGGYWGGYWGPPVVVAPPPAIYGPAYGPVYAPAAPPVYVEKDSDNATPPASNQWLYLCNEPRGVYPDVRQCPGGWERVPAVRPGQVR